MKKTLLIAIAAMFVAMGANAQAKKLNGHQKPLSIVEKQVTSPKVSFAPDNFGPMTVTLTKDAVRRAPADIAGTYILDEKNWDRDFTSSSTFTVEEAAGTIVLDMYDKDEETGEYPTFDYNVKITDFTYAGTVAYGFYDEETKEIFIPVQTTIAEMIGSNGTNYGRIVFSSMVLDQEGEALSYGYPMVLLINDDGTVEVEEGDFSEEAEENPEYEGAYIGGYCNFLPDYGEEGAIWNYGFEIELFIPNAMMQDNEVHIENGGWGNWAWTSRPVFVEDFDTEYVVHNFFGLCPISISVEGDQAGIATPVRVMEYNYADEGEDPNYIQIWQWNEEFDEIINPGLITGNITEEDGVKYIEFYETEYKEAWTDPDGTEHPAGNYYITDYTKWFMVHSTWGDSGAYWWGEARYTSIAIPLETTGITELKNDGRQLTTSKTYNLLGQEVTPATKGLVIKDGKKMIVK
jgi:hypothetical protein